ncbi:hypothetical protein Tco_0691744, partial [Tanacetum coccineum]
GDDVAVVVVVVSRGVGMDRCGDDIDGGVLVVVSWGVRQRQEWEAEDGGRLV